MFRISVTTLEKFRRYMAGVSPFDTEEALIESIKGIFKGNDKTRFGSAYHELIEGKYVCPDRDRYQVGDYLFSGTQASPAVLYKMNHMIMVHELPYSCIFKTNYFYIQVTARIDGMEGACVRDVKTKFRDVAVQEYLDSYQWRYYLHMTGLDHFFYDVFQVTGFDQVLKRSLMLDPAKIFQESIQVQEPVEIHCKRYDGMQQELTTLLNDFLDYIHSRNLLCFLKPANEINELNF
jgi:hypothetical protein